MVVSSSSIQELPELLTTQRDLNYSSSDLQKTANGFNLVPYVLKAKHMRQIHYSSNKQILLLTYRL